MAKVLTQLVVAATIASVGVAGWQVWSKSQSGAEAQGGGRERPAPGVEVAEASIAPLERTISAVGTGRPLRSVELAPSSSGRVVEVAFQGGEIMQAGDLILRLEDTDQRTALIEAEAEVTLGTSALERQKTLKAQGRVTDINLEAAQAEMSAAVANLARAEKALSDRRLTAPFDGIIGFRLVDEGAIVGPETTIASLDDISALNVDFAVPERFYGEVAIGATVRATTEIFAGEAFDGTLTRIGRSIDTVSRSFTARARIENPGRRLPADVFMRIRLILEARDGIVVPEEAISAEGGGIFVYAVSDDKVQRRPVTIGIRSSGRVEITSGVAPGEIVVTRGLQKVRDGAPVRILNPAGS
ncbi:MAG: efflux RND transporter periplasmic adaptor subunit [Pseudomonadota bacterium]